MKNFTYPAIFLITALMLALTIATFYPVTILKPFRTEQRQLIYIDADDNLDSVFQKVHTTGKPVHTYALQLTATLKNYSKKIHTGAYRITSDDTYWTLITRLQLGQQTPVNVVVPGPRTIGQLLQRVSKQLMTDSASLAAVIADSSYYIRMGFTRETLPALFIPNTYQVYWNMDPEDFFQRMHKEYKRFWNQERLQKAQAIGLTPVEVATLASIVDEETAYNPEKPIIAGLYLNRLRRNMPLQADPTIKFSMNEPALRRILFKHLEVESPYNTYKHTGLPPGPIRIPSIAGLQSVLNAEKHNYLYMCAKETLDGTHNFASTLAAHQRNARKYQQELNRRKIH